MLVANEVDLIKDPNMEDEALVAFLDDVDEGNADILLRDLIFNEKRAVTYAFVATRLNMSLEAARKHMDRFFKEWRDKDRPLYGVYYLSGTMDVNSVQVYKAGLVRDKNLDKAKEQLTDVSSCHVYSLQCAEVKDMATVLLADGIGCHTDKDKTFIPITCENAVPRVITESAERHSTGTAAAASSAAPVSVKPKTPPQKDAPAEKPQKEKPVEKHQLKSAHVGTRLAEKKKSTAASKDTSPSKKQARLTSFFTKP